MFLNQNLLHRFKKLNMMSSTKFKKVRVIREDILAAFKDPLALRCSKKRLTNSCYNINKVTFS